MNVSVWRRFRNRGIVQRILTICRQLLLTLIRADRVKLHGVVLRTRHLAANIRQTIYVGDYESKEAKIVAEAIKPGDVVLELGTGVGFITTKVAKLGAKQIYTFEANPTLRDIVLETFRLNGVQPELHSAILGKAAGSADFYVDKVFWSSSTVPREGATKVEVPVLSFNEFVGDKKPNILICDIEGGEADLFKFADLSSFERIIIELHPNEVGTT